MATYSETIPRKPGHYVYRLWAADGACLYVGCTGERSPQPVRVRVRQHKRKPWWPQVARTDFAGFASGQQAADEERTQIAQLQPTHNKKLLGRCTRGHDTTAHSARTPDGKCRECQRQKDAERRVRQAQEDREYRRRPDVKARAAAAARLYRAGGRYRVRRSGPAPGQQPLW